MANKLNEIVVDKKIKIRKYNINWVTTPSTMACIGPSNSGKSYFARRLCYVLRNRIPLGIVISGTESFNNQYSGTFPDLFIFEKFEEKILDSVFKRQRKLKLKCNKYPEIAKKYNINNQILVLADDVMHDKRWKKDENTTFMFVAGRHAWATFIFLMQYPLGVQPEFRGNLKHIFLFKDGDPDNQHRMYEHYVKGVIPTEKIFRKIFELCTNDYKCLVIDRTREGEWMNQVFWYKAKDPGPYKFGAKIIWDYYKKNYCKKWEERELKEDSIKKRDGPNIQLTSEKEQQARDKSERRQNLLKERHSGLNNRYNTGSSNIPYLEKPKNEYYDKKYDRTLRRTRIKYDNEINPEYRRSRTTRSRTTRRRNFRTSRSRSSSESPVYRRNTNFHIDYESVRKNRPSHT